VTEIFFFDVQRAVSLSEADGVPPVGVEVGVDGEEGFVGFPLFGVSSSLSVITTGGGVFFGGKTKSLPFSGAFQHIKFLWPGKDLHVYPEPQFESSPGFLQLVKHSMV